jgi:hypothetical protein
LAAAAVSGTAMEADVLDEKGHTKQHERLFYLTARMTGGQFFRENINRKIPI